MKADHRELCAGRYPLLEPCVLISRHRWLIKLEVGSSIVAVAIQQLKPIISLHDFCENSDLGLAELLCSCGSCIARRKKRQRYKHVCMCGRFGRTSIHADVSFQYTVPAQYTSLRRGAAFIDNDCFNKQVETIMVWHIEYRKQWVPAYCGQQACCLPWKTLKLLYKDAEIKSILNNTTDWNR